MQAPIEVVTKPESPAPESGLMKAFETRDIKKFQDALKHVDDVNVVDLKTGLTIFEKILKANDADYSIEFMQECIKHANLNRINENGQHPLHLVAESACVAKLKILLVNYKRSDMNVKYMNDNCLHILTKKLMKIDNSDEISSFNNISECMQMLLKKGCDPNLPDEEKKTPFYYLLKAQKKFGENSLRSFVSRKSKDAEKMHLEEIGKLVEYFIEYSKIDFIEKEKMQQLFEELNPNHPIPDWQKRENYFDFLFNELMTQSNEIRFKNHFEIFKAKSSPEKWNNSRLIYKAVENNIVGIVEYLVKEDIEVNEENEKFEGTPLAFIAAEKSSHQVLEILLNSSKLKLKTLHKEKTLLHVVCEKFSEKNVPVGNQKCFSLIMEHCTNIDVNAKNKEGNNALYYAASFHNVKAQKMLLDKGSYLGTEDKCSPVLNIDKNALEDHLDDCVTTDLKTLDNENDEEDIIVDFSFLIHPDKRNDQKLVLDMDLLKTIMKNKKLRKLISHPVLQTCVQLKWRKFQNCFMLNLIFFLFFLMISFIGFITIDQPELRTFFQVTTTIGLIVLIIREAFQLFHSGFSDYFAPNRSYMNYLEIFLICVAIRVLYFIDAYDTSAESQIMKISTIVLVSYEMMQLLNPLSKFDVSVHMYIMTKVAKTFLNSIVIFSTPLIAFSLCFYILSVAKKSDSEKSSSADGGEDESNFNSFDDLGIALVKTFVMMTGEFDASNFKFNENLPILIVFILYVFFGFMVIFNLLNALAINDTNEVKSEGQLIDLLQKIEWLSRHTSILEKIKSLRKKINCKVLKSASQQESNILKSDKGKAHLRFKKNEEVSLEFGSYIRKLPMSEDLIKQFHWLLERKEKNESKKMIKKDLDYIKDLLMKMQPSTEGMAGKNI